ncbi:LysE family translocator [Halocynthiibacter styelae]|uniref:LysE family translocator n=1 Tax=Halocynthiibacter styelae TaxID=2761955 RepID=A0A8J7IFL6_9RHOB|nr:LysE family translocator [Paenihalocynthiibacter styelae]MBI1495162.1 LysE family translocator [Paenihalocynthiibacter styelae]
MIPFETLTLFFGASVMLALAPGPDNVFVLTQSAMNGRVAGLFVTLGLCTGLLFHTTAVALGVAAIFQTSEIAFTLLKFAGAGYLLYLAYKAFRAGSTAIEGERAEASLKSLYLRGLIMNITNPKVAIFFLAFLPQFARPEFGPLIPQLMILGAVMAVSTILVFGSVAIGAGSLGDWLKARPSAQIWINRVAGLVFVGLAAKLITAQR